MVQFQANLNQLERIANVTLFTWFDPYGVIEAVHENAQRHRQLSCHGRAYYEPG